MSEEKKQETTPQEEPKKDKKKAEPEAKKVKAEETPQAKDVATDEPKEEDSSSAEAMADKKTALEEAEEEVANVTTKKKRGKNKNELSELEPKDIKPGMIIRVHLKIIDANSKGEEKERIQVFQGMVLAKKHGNEAGATITVRKVSGGIGVERIFPTSMPAIAKFELVRKYAVRQSRPYYLRTHKKRLTEIKDI